MTDDALTPLIAPLLALDFESRVEVAERMGLVLACCDDCGCFLTRPGCHTADEATSAWESCACPLKEDPTDD